TNPESKVFYL
nr:Chain C, 14-3-3 PROTEIN THETA [Gallus gallus]